MSRHIPTLILVATLCSCVSPPQEEPKGNLISFNFSSRPVSVFDACRMLSRLRNPEWRIPEFTDDSLPEAALQEIQIQVQFTDVPPLTAFQRIMDAADLTGTAYTNGVYRIQKKESANQEMHRTK